jgi:hypothetical protein
MDPRKVGYQRHPAHMVLTGHKLTHLTSFKKNVNAPDVGHTDGHFDQGFVLVYIYLEE